RRQCPQRRACVPVCLSLQVTALDDGCELLRLRQGALESVVPVGQVVTKTVDGLLVTKALEADPLELRLELLHALLAGGHLAAELLQLAPQVLQPRRLGVEQTEYALERSSPHRRRGGGAICNRIRAGRCDSDRGGVEQRGQCRGLDHADVDGAGEVLANTRNALRGRVREGDANAAVA